MTELKKRVMELMRKDPMRAKQIAAVVCIGLVLFIAVLSLALTGHAPAEEAAGKTENTASSLPAEWPENELLRGMEPPSDVKIAAVNQTEKSVAVFVEDFPAEKLRPYLQSTGLTFEGSAPYVAKDGERTVVLEYSAKEKRLSITVVSE